MQKGAWLTRCKFASTLAYSSKTSFSSGEHCTAPAEGGAVVEEARSAIAPKGEKRRICRSTEADDCLIRKVGAEAMEEAWRTNLAINCGVGRMGVGRREACGSARD